MHPVVRSGRHSCTPYSSCLAIERSTAHTSATLHLRWVKCRQSALQIRHESSRSASGELPEHFLFFQNYLKKGANLFTGGYEAAKKASMQHGIEKALSQKTHTLPQRRRMLACIGILPGERYGSLLDACDDVASYTIQKKPIPPDTAAYKVAQLLRLSGVPTATASSIPSPAPAAVTNAGTGTSKDTAKAAKKAKPAKTQAEPPAAKDVGRVAGRKAGRLTRRAGTQEAESVSVKVRNVLAKPSPQVPEKKPPSKVAAAAERHARAKEEQSRPEKSSASSARAVEPRVLPIPKNTPSLLVKSVLQEAVEVDDVPQVPGLSFDLSRVLFNPGVYQLQDSRTRVYNFDPYLEKIMQVSDFNFDLLNPYMTSSEDDTLRRISLKHKKRYIGSSSSMTAAMSQFHFLLSAWRPINYEHLSQSLASVTKLVGNYTAITRAPSSIFLRWRDGVYAIDADKEHDAPNILMMQGKSMEKLLTLEKDEFEKFRKPKDGDQAAEVKLDPEAFHYSTCEDFLLRSQLDAHDPRLPGTGMFDLKTRAVAAVRMLLRDHEAGMGYEIKGNHGLWESYDREYYDMIRSAFLKYSLQVRMGRMDGIFVAYHNIARIFGFQYISIDEMDHALHGQTDTTLGHQEFRATLKLMNELFDRATKEFPEKSLRIMFNTSKGTASHPNGEMEIFVEPMTEEQINTIQKAGKAKVAAYEESMYNGVDPRKVAREAKANATRSLADAMNARPSTLESNAPDHKFLEEILSIDMNTPQPQASVPETSETTTSGDLASWTLKIVNSVNGLPVIRPEGLSDKDDWKIHYQFDRLNNPLIARNALDRCRKLRDAAFNFDDEQGDAYLGPYHQNLLTLSQGGQEYRSRLTEQEADKPKIVWQSTPAQAKAVADAAIINTAADTLAQNRDVE